MTLKELNDKARALGADPAQVVLQDGETAQTIRRADFVKEIPTPWYARLYEK